MKLGATIRQRPSEGARNVDGLDERVIQAEGDDYDTARHSLEGQVPEGWQMLHIRRL